MSRIHSDTSIGVCLWVRLSLLCGCCTIGIHQISHMSYTLHLCHSTSPVSLSLFSSCLTPSSPTDTPWVKWHRWNGVSITNVKCLLFTDPYVIPILYDFHPSVEHKIKILFLKPYNESQQGSKQHWRTPLAFILCRKRNHVHSSKYFLLCPTDRKKKI